MCAPIHLVVMCTGGTMKTIGNLKDLQTQGHQFESVRDPGRYKYGRIPNNLVIALDYWTHKPCFLIKTTKDIEELESAYRTQGLLNMEFFLISPLP